MGFNSSSLFPVLLPAVVLLLAVGILMPSGEPRSAQGLPEGVAGTAVSSATIEPAAAAPAVAAPAEAAPDLPGDAASYGTGLVAGAFIVAVAVVTRGRFIP